jgi:hypothetical protein
VAPPSPCLSLLVLTEDSGADGHATVTALVKKMLGLLVQGYGAHRIEWVPRTEEARRAMSGTAWKSNERGRRVDLHQIIAGKLLESNPSGFVLFHVDGDRTWTDRASSENVAKLDQVTRTRVEQHVTAVLGKRDRLAEKDERMARLLPLIPFYSIESWVLQNGAEGRRLCEESGCGRHVETFATWEKDRTLLDDVQRPKDATCLRDRHNAELAGADFPAQAVFDAGRSFAATVCRLLDCPALGEALGRTAAP